MSESGEQGGYEENKSEFCTDCIAGEHPPRYTKECLCCKNHKIRAVVRRSFVVEMENQIVMDKLNALQKELRAKGYSVLKFK